MAVAAICTAIGPMGMGPESGQAAEAPLIPPPSWVVCNGVRADGPGVWNAGSPAQNSGPG